MLCMVSTCPRSSIVVPRGRLWRALVDDAVHVDSESAQVAAVRARVDIDHRLHVVVAFDLGRRGSLEAGQIVEQLDGAAVCRAP